ncbi:MAG: DUF4097 family beta strand repeat protein [Candidatus Eremiobacteraeota bacterium]|nr:DUF4097 family beta strand repeat protein [Candidatus Eremiobacteraeota bacterium]
MKRTIAIIACALLAAACSQNGEGGRITDSHKVHQSVHQSFASSSSPAISISNTSGNISVSGWSQPRVQIDVDKYGENQSDLANSEIVIDHSPDEISIKTHYANGTRGFAPRQRGGEVYYTLHVPKDSQLKIRNVTGDESATGVGGKFDAQSVSGEIKADSLTTDADVSTTSGSISLAFAKSPQNGSINVRTVSGPIAVRVPANIGATVDAGSVSGDFSTDFPSVRPQKRDVGSKASGTIGSGGTTIKLGTVSGGIELRKT